MEYYPLINPAALPKEQRANGLIAISSSSSQQGKQDKSPLPSPQELTCAPPSPSINPPPSSPPRPSSDQNPEPFLATDHGDRCCCVPGTRATLPSVRSRHPCSRVVLIRSFFLLLACRWLSRRRSSARIAASGAPGSRCVPQCPSVLEFANARLFWGNPRDSVG